MPNNVAQVISKSDSQHTGRPDAQHLLYNGQKPPAPFLHELSSILNASPLYYLKTPELARLLEHLQVTISGRGAMQVIIADHGRGKSSLLRQLIVENGHHWLLCYIHADYQLGVEHIINALGQVFFPQETVDFESLVHGLASYGHNEPAPVVIVDDAQNLSSYAIETLVNIKCAVAEQGGDVDIILCATPVMRKALSSHSISRFRQKWIEVHSLPRLNEEETTRYLNNHFEKRGESLFTPSQLQIINRRGCGIPACINYHAELALGHAISDEHLRLEHQGILARQKKMPYYFAAGGAALLMLIVILLSATNIEQDLLIDEPAIASSAPIESISEKTMHVTSPAVSRPAATKPVPAKTTAVKPVENRAQPKSAPVVNESPIKTVAVANAKPLQQPKVVPAQPKPKEVKAVATVKPLAIKSKPRPEVKKAVAVKPAVGVPLAKESMAPAVIATSEEVIPGALWLKAQPAENYTIQLAGSPSEKDIIRYITRSSMEGELAYLFVTRENRRGWYVVLHGSFKSRAEAQGMVDFFPPELRKNQPWIRKISKLQNLLRDKPSSE